MLEPVGRNTAPVVDVAAIDAAPRLALRISPDALSLVMPADPILNGAAVKVARSKYRISAIAKTKGVAWLPADGVGASRIQAFAASCQDALADPTLRDPLVRNPNQSLVR